MAQVKLLKIAADGVPLEHTGSADDVTFLSFSVTGSGPVLSGSGLDMQNQDVVDVSDLAFNDPAAGTINQTAGALIVDNIMAKERENVLTTAASVLFPVIADSAGEVDAFRLPALAGAPTATPTASGEGFLVFDSSGNKIYAWSGSAWVDTSAAATASTISNSYTADEALSARDVLYISAADNVSKADNSASGSSQVIGLAASAAIDTASVQVVTDGIMGGFSGLTPGARYYLGSAGAITATIPAGSGNSVVQVGYAKSATELQINMLQMGRRA